MEKIDAVITWVDGNNPEWKNRFEKYSNLEASGDKREIRFRDWGILPFWFRAVENFAPWIRKIHFVTSGELPNWLDITAPKLNWVRHEDFIPKEFLPTFSINTIETNLHRIEGLAEKFIFFNDDMILTNDTRPTDYFRNGLPADFAILDPIFPEKYPGIFVNDIRIINRHFSKHEVIKRHFAQWINPVYGKYLLKSLLLLPWKKFSGILSAHQPQPFLKSTFEEVWKANPDILRSTCMSRFRTNEDVNQWLFRYWHLAKGEFSPSNVLARSNYFEISKETIDSICEAIIQKKFKQICLNDDDGITDFHVLSGKIQNALTKILPQKSSFEL